MKVTHIITGTSTGGAEMMLYKLVAAQLQSGVHAEVISLTDIGAVGERIAALGVRVRALGMRRGVPTPGAVWRLVRWLRADRPDLVQTWMYHADLIGGVAAKLAGRLPVIWGIHHSNLSPAVNKRMTLWTAAACARLSRWLPAQIIACSEAAARVHEQIGYAPERLVVIPNGFDLSLFRPDQTARAAVRQELGLPTDACLIGLVARFDPQKDHRSFIQAAGLVAATEPAVHFLLCGEGVTPANAELARWVAEAAIADRCHLLGRRDDVPRLMAALDLLTLASVGEGFPNVIGEAMACGVPCVVTDVGDAALIVGETGRVVPPGNPQALAEGWQALIRLDPAARQELGEAARHRVETRFALPLVAAHYQEVQLQACTSRQT